MWDWNVGLEYGTGMWDWNVGLECGTGMWDWNMGLECGTGMWEWNVELECGTRVWDWTGLTIPSFRLPFTHFTLLSIFPEACRVQRSLDFYELCV